MGRDLHSRKTDIRETEREREKIYVYYISERIE
jgi:hypothetical protein